MKRFVLPAVLAALAVLSSAVALRAPEGPEAPSGGEPAAQTPALSLRRVPDLLVRAVGRARLQTELDAILADPQLGGAGESSCLVVEAAGHRLFEARPDLPLIPASTLKLVTAAAALEALGPEHTFTTDVRAAVPVKDGVVDGDLFLVGGGDPLLSTADYVAIFRNQPQIATSFEELADAVVAAGVREIRGRVVGDHSRYDDERLHPNWRSAYVQQGHVGPIDALVLNDSFIRYRSPQRREAVTGDPAGHAAMRLLFLLQERGVSVGGGAAVGLAPPGAAPVTSLRSPPMRQIVAEMLTESDNNTAEGLTKELGFRRYGSGSWQAGIAAAHVALQGSGYRWNDDALVSIDGSGLDRGNRASCALLLQALVRGGGDVRNGLPVAGETGTLAHRFVGTAVAGKMRAKTGGLAGVVSLAGFVEGGEESTFALVLNALPSDALGLGVQERVAATLLTYPKAPPVEALAPLPAQRP